MACQSILLFVAPSASAVFVDTLSYASAQLSQVLEVQSAADEPYKFPDILETLAKSSAIRDENGAKKSELHLEIDALDNPTLWRLYKMVKQGGMRECDSPAKPEIGEAKC